MIVFTRLAALTFCQCPRVAMTNTNFTISLHSYYPPAMGTLWVRTMKFTPAKGKSKLAGAAWMINTSVRKCQKMLVNEANFLINKDLFNISFTFGCYSKLGRWFSLMEWWRMFKSLILTLQAAAMFTGGC